MNLNQQAMEEFAESVDENGVTLVASPAPQAGDTPQEVTPTPEQLFQAPVVNHELPTLNAEFVLVEDLNDHLTDMQSIKVGLDQAKAIDRTEAMAIESIVPGFAHRRMPLVGFTQLKTATQLKLARESMDVQLDLKFGQLVKATQDLATAATAYVTGFVRAADQVLLDIQAASTEVFAKVLEGKVEFSDTLSGSVSSYLENKDTPGLALREEIQQILFELPGADNVCHYLSGEDRPTVIMEGRSVVVYNDSGCEVVKSSVYEDEHRNQSQFATFGGCSSLSELMRALYGTSIVTAFGKLKQAVEVTSKDLETVTERVKALEEDTGMDLNAKAQAVGAIAADVQFKYLCVIAIASTMKKLHRVAMLLAETFREEIKAAEVAVAPAAGFQLPVQTTT